MSRLRQWLRLPESQLFRDQLNTLAIEETLIAVGKSMESLDEKSEAAWAEHHFRQAKKYLDFIEVMELIASGKSPNNLGEAMDYGDIELRSTH